LTGKACLFLSGCNNLSSGLTWNPMAYMYSKILQKNNLYGRKPVYIYT